MYSYSGSFIWKEKRSWIKHFQKYSNILQFDYLQITQQAQPIYIHHNFSLQEHTIRNYRLQQSTCYFPSYLYYLSYLTLSKKYDLEKITLTSTNITGIRKPWITTSMTWTTTSLLCLQYLLIQDPRKTIEKKNSQSFHPNYQLMKNTWINRS